MVSVGAAYEQGEAKRDYNACHVEYKSRLSATIYANMLILQSVGLILYISPTLTTAAEVIYGGYRNRRHIICEAKQSSAVISKTCWFS